MTATRDANFRSGDRKESFGIHLLSGIAAVAKVPREEDFGIDVIGTLLRRNGRKLLAEQSFYVQLKSSSLTSVQFSGHEKQWLFALDLPFFIGSVGGDSIALYATHVVSQAVAEQVRQETISLEINDAAEAPTDEVVSYALGKPIAQWSLSDENQPEKMAAIYLALKSHIEIDTANRIQRAVGRYNTVKWETNSIAEIKSLKHVDNFLDDERFKKLFQQFRLYAEPTVIGLSSRGEMETSHMLITVMEKLEQYEVAPPGQLPSWILKMVAPVLLLPAGQLPPGMDSSPSQGS